MLGWGWGLESACYATKHWNRYEHSAAVLVHAALKVLQFRSRKQSPTCVDDECECIGAVTRTCRLSASAPSCAVLVGFRLCSSETFLRGGSRAQSEGEGEGEIQGDE